VVPSNVVGIVVLAMTKTYGDLVRDNKAVVIIELVDWSSPKSLVGHFANCKASILECEEREANILQCLVDYYATF
jgi:hypothetical protein